MQARPVNPRPRMLAVLGVPVATVSALLAAHVLEVGRPAPVGPGPHTFHVSARGDDRADGLTPDTAWRSLERADWTRLKPGDRLLLEGGARLPGSLRLGPDEAGEAANPVVIGSYGSGRATIDAASGSAITVFNTAGVEIRDLVLVGGAEAYDTGAGVDVYSDRPGAGRHRGLRLSNLDVSGFRAGVGVGAAAGAAGFGGVVVRDSVLHGNKEFGMHTFGPDFDAAAPAYAHEDLSVTGVEAYGTRGDPANRVRNTGSGIVLGSVRSGVVQRSVAHDNGSAVDAPEGPVGIWTYDSTRVLIQHNVSYRNRTAGDRDGGGFDLDQNVSSSVLQYNHSYDNDGAGYMLYSRYPNGAHTGNVVRFNVSSDDARKLSRYGGILVTGEVSDAHIYHNTVTITGTRATSAPAVNLRGNPRRVTIRNNLLVADRAPLVTALDFARGQVLFQGNNLYTTAGPWTVGWGDEVYRGLRRWRAATGQERVRGADSGLAADPRFAGRASGPGTLTAFVPDGRSPVVGGALDLSTFGTDPGPVDITGRPLGRPATIGAAQPAG